MDIKVAVTLKTLNKEHSLIKSSNEMQVLSVTKYK